MSIRKFPWVSEQWRKTRVDFHARWVYPLSHSGLPSIDWESLIILITSEYAWMTEGFWNYLELWICLKIVYYDRALCIRSKRPEENWKEHPMISKLGKSILVVSQRQNHIYIYISYISYICSMLGLCRGQVESTLGPFWLYVYVGWLINVGLMLGLSWAKFGNWVDFGSLRKKHWILEQ